MHDPDDLPPLAVEQLDPSDHELAEFIDSTFRWIELGARIVSSARAVYRAQVADEAIEDYQAFADEIDRLSDEFIGLINELDVLISRDTGEEADEEIGEDVEPLGGELPEGWSVAQVESMWRLLERSTRCPREDSNLRHTV